MKIFKTAIVFIFFFLNVFFFTSQEVYSVMSARISNLSEPNTFFTGRDKEITVLRLALDKQTIIIVEGLSGIGKTQLAKKYSESALNKYDLIWWFDSEKNMDTQVDELLVKLYRHANKPYYRPANSKELIKKFKAELSLTALTYLLVFDNVDDINIIHHYAPLKRNDMRSQNIIVTSKKKNNVFPSLLIDRFERKESLAFLAKILEREKEEDLDTLAETLGDFPLALAQAASYIKMNPSVRVKTYIELFKENYAELWKSEGKLIEDTESGAYFNDSYHQSMATAIKMNIEAIKKLSPLAYEMLCFCSLLHHQHIPINILEHWACTKRGASKIEFHEALSLLLNYFLLEKEATNKDKQDQDFFHQHELIQLIAADTGQEEREILLLNEVSESLIHDIVNSPFTLLEQFKGREYFYNHLKKSSDLAEELNVNATPIVELRMALLYFTHFFQRDFDQAAVLTNALQTQRNESLSPLAQVWFYCVVVNDYMFEDVTKVQENYKKAMEYVEKIQDEETKRSYLLHLSLDYAESLSNFGRTKEATTLWDGLKEAIKTTKNESQKPYYFGTSAIIRLKHGQYDLCLKAIDSCFEAIEKKKDPEYLPFAMMFKAHCLLYQGKAQEAYELVEKSYPLLLDIFGTPDCAMVVNAQLIRGGCLSALGRLTEAFDVVRQTLDSYEHSSGYENDVLKGMGHRILGEIYEAEGNLSKAYEEYVIAESIYAKILQEKSLADLGLLYMRFAILGAKMKDDVMVNKYLTLHIQDFGLSHPRTLEIKEYLDGQGLSLPL
jgi:predicted DNA-binding protein